MFDTNTRTFLCLSFRYLGRVPVRTVYFVFQERIQIEKKFTRDDSKIDLVVFSPFSLTDPIPTVKKKTRPLSPSSCLVFPFKLKV